MLTFDENTHTYTLDGVIVPSVTQLIDRAGMMDKSGYTQEARDRGTAVHKAIEQYDTAPVGMYVPDSAVAAYVEQWGEFKRQSKLVVLHNEFRVGHKKHGYAGTLDIYGALLHGYCVLDVKTGQKPSWVKAQLGAYSLALRAMRKRVDQVCCLELSDTKYTLFTYPRIEAEAEWMAVLEKVKR